MSRLTARLVASLTLAAVLGLAGCTGESPAPAPAPSSSTASPDSTGAAASPTPTAPAVLVPHGSAVDNLPYFTSIVAGVASGADSAAGRAYIDALVSGGFDKAAMQVTQDQSTIGNPAESIEFAVRWGDKCLVGQVGPSIGAPVTAVLPGLGTGGCLIGQTRPIDW